MNDPYPDDLLDLENAPPAPAPTQDALIKAVHRLAQAVEQLTLATLDKPAPARSNNLHPLPQVQTVANTPACPKHGPDKVKPSTKFPGFYCTAKDPQGSRGYCSWSQAA